MGAPLMRSMAGYLREGAGPSPFCPGCGHGILMGAVLRAIDRLQLDLQDLLFVSGIGCGGWIPSPHFDADTLHALHGRAIPFATGAKLANPSRITIVISGDGDLWAIGGNHLIHAARRDIDMTVICANNQVFGMTGGQRSPTAPDDRAGTTDHSGYRDRPFDLTELVIASGARYAACFPVTRPAALSDAIERALSLTGFTFVEALTPCPTHPVGGGATDLTALYDQLDRCCKSVEEMEAIPEDERNQYLLMGEFTS